jgi:hypothetical protein
MGVKIIFGDSENLNSQEEEDGWAVITEVNAVREHCTIGVEDKRAKHQGAHITADVVWQYGAGALLVGRNWCDAWRAVERMGRYLDGLAHKWERDPVLRAQVTRLNRVSASAKRAVQTAQFEHTRDGVALSRHTWYLEPEEKEGSSYEDRRGRRQYCHGEPLVVPDGYVKRQWSPKLAARFVERLARQVEEWIELRSLLPWTSLDRDSENKGEAAAAKAVSEMLKNISESGTATDEDVQNVVDKMLSCFDFKPRTLTTKRSTTLAAAVAARHLTDHFLFYPSIPDAVRHRIVDRFLAAWKAQVRQMERGEESEAAAEMVNGWPSIKRRFYHYVSTFGAAIDLTPDGAEESTTVSISRGHRDSRSGTKRKLSGGSTTNRDVRTRVPAQRSATSTTTRSTTSEKRKRSTTGKDERSTKKGRKD